MGIPITKTVKLSWDGVNWRDPETNVLVTGVLPPYPVDSAVYSGEWQPGDRSMDSKAYSSEYATERTIRIWWDSTDEVWRHKETGDLYRGDVPEIAPSQPDEGSVTYEQAQKMIDNTIARRSVPKQLMYSVSDDWLITYAYHSETMLTLTHQINVLRRRIERLECPWWKRW